MGDYEMDPKYSILLCNQDIEEYEDLILTWLLSGIKVIWFGGQEDVDYLYNEHQEFVKALFLLVYETGLQKKGIIVDGVDEENLLADIEKDCPIFNSAQYRVEHCQANEHIIVQASAGTGKTTVMIDRILYLMHVVPNLHMSDIYMITFTNDATNEMNKRLQEKLMQKYHLTNQRRYLRWLEEQSQMSISTIHSFAYNMLKEYGIMEGFTKSLGLRSFAYESKELIYKILDSHTDNQSSVVKQLGLPLYKANSMVNKYWEKFRQQGVSRQEVSLMDWGQPADEASEAFQDILTKVVEEVDDEFYQIKQHEDAIGVDDMMRDLQEVLLNEDIPTPDITMKYLFIDEFQDTDISQIKVATLLVKYLRTTLFVVGDIKQSIYKFRGATAKAFQILERDMKEMGQKNPKHFALVNNYRTGRDLMYELERLFKGMDKLNYLEYKNSVVPFKQSDSYFSYIEGEKKEYIGQQIVDIVNKALIDLETRVEESGKEPNEKDRVVVLVRYNSQLDRVAGLLRDKGIPVEVKREGSFYNSEAVRDFYAMICSFMYPDEPKHVFNYLMSPYAGNIDPIDVNEMERLNGDKDLLFGYLQKYVNQTSWARFYKDLRLRPVMSVIKEIVDSGNIVDCFIMMTKSRLKAMTEPQWEEKRINAETTTRAKQYQADLEKLLEVLQLNMGNEKVSLYDIYHFLKLSISTNRDEGEAKVDSRDDYHSVLCMTAHKSKGLEFDTVIIPYTNGPFMTNLDTEIIIDPLTRKVGWKYGGDEHRHQVPMQNSYYAALKQQDVWSVHQEEARILYVAMTRAIHACIVVVPWTNQKNTWAFMLTEVF